jgi:hypothetical protein
MGGPVRRDLYGQDSDGEAAERIQALTSGNVRTVSGSAGLKGGSRTLTLTPTRLAHSRRKRLPAVRVARAAAISRARLAALEQGTNWPRWDLLMRLRVAREDIEYGDDTD